MCPPIAIRWHSIVLSPLYVQLSESLALAGVLIAGLAGIATIVGIVYGVRYKVAYEAERAASIALRESLADERARVKRLEGLATEQAEQLRGAQDTVARLEALPNLAHIVKILDQHEQRAQERHENTARVLGALTERIETSGHMLERFADRLDTLDPARERG